MAERNASTNLNSSNNHSVSTKRAFRYAAELEIGRISITYPRYGRLDIYLKPDKIAARLSFVRRTAVATALRLGFLNTSPK